jgi:membrane protein required for colicin V production
VVGYRQGAVKQVASLVGIVLGLILATVCYDSFGDLLADKTGATLQVSRMLAFIFIVLVVPVGMGWFAAFLTQVFKRLKINFINRILGMAIGVFSYGLIISVAFNILDFMTSNAGFRIQKLAQRPDVFYGLKYVTQPFIPDILIVTDSTEIANGMEPKYGLQTAADEAIRQFQ